MSNQIKIYLKTITILISSLLFIVIFCLLFPRAYFDSGYSQEFSNLNFTRNKTENSYIYSVSFLVTNQNFEAKTYNNLQIELSNLENGNSQFLNIDSFSLEHFEQKNISLSYTNQLKFDNIKLYTINELGIRNYMCSFTIEENDWFQNWGHNMIYVSIVIISILLLIFYARYNKISLFILSICVSFLALMFSLISDIFIDVDIIGYTLSILSIIVPFIYAVAESKRKNSNN